MIECQVSKREVLNLPPARLVVSDRILPVLGFSRMIITVIMRELRYKSIIYGFNCLIIFASLSLSLLSVKAH